VDGHSNFHGLGTNEYLPIANSCLHEKNQIYSWITMLNCEKNTEAVKEANRINKRIGICLFRNHAG